MRLFASAAVLAVFLSAPVFAPAFAQEAPDAPAVTQPVAAKKDAKKNDGVICHREIPTGSQFPVKVCTTGADRKAQNKAAQKAQETMQGPTSVIPN
jgi:hypothetical protein